jgi:hypothetical protein
MGCERGGRGRRRQLCHGGSTSVEISVRFEINGGKFVADYPFCCTQSVLVGTQREQNYVSQDIVSRPFGKTE